MRTRIDPGQLMLGIALLIGAATRLVALGAQSIHVDEAHTFLVASKPWPAMIDALTTSDYHPPLFYALTHLIVGLGWHQETYRYLTAPLALVTIFATWAIARRVFSSTTVAGIAALVIAIDPSAILWDRLYRMYVLLDALVALSWWLLIAADDARGAKRVWLWIGFAACALAQPYVHYLGALDVACQAIYGLTRLRRAWPAVASAVLSAMAFLWWLPHALKQLPGGGLVAGTASLPIQWWTIARDAVLAGTPLAWIQAPGFDVVVTIVVVAMSVWAAWSARRSILPFWLLVAAVQVVLSVFSGKFIAAPRYLLPVLPVFAIGVGQVVQRHLLLPNVRVAAFAVGGAILALLAFCTTNELFDPRYQFADWNIVKTIVAQRAQPGDAVIFDQGYTVEAFATDPAFQAYPTWPVDHPQDVISTRSWLHEQHVRRVWYVENEFYYVDPDRAVIAMLENTRPQLGEWLEPRVELSNRVYIALFGPERSSPKTKRP